MKAKPQITPVQPCRNWPHTDRAHVCFMTASFARIPMEIGLTERLQHLAANHGNARAWMPSAAFPGRQSLVKASPKSRLRHDEISVSF
jgi:hypothetical protein